MPHVCQMLGPISYLTVQWAAPILQLLDASTATYIGISVSAVLGAGGIGLRARDTVWVGADLLVTALQYIRSSVEHRGQNWGLEKVWLRTKKTRKLGIALVRAERAGRCRMRVRTSRPTSGGLSYTILQSYYRELTPVGFCGHQGHCQA